MPGAETGRSAQASVLGCAVTSQSFVTWDLAKLGSSDGQAFQILADELSQLRDYYGGQIPAALDRRSAVLLQPHIDREQLAREHPDDQAVEWSNFNGALFHEFLHVSDNRSLIPSWINANKLLTLGRYSPAGTSTTK